jgi:hypothetical protein
MVTAEDFTNRLFGSRHEIVTYYTNSLVTAYAVETRAPFYNAAKRGGVDKITFRPLFGESVFTTNSIFTNTYLDTVYILTNGVEMEMQQTLRRVMRGPDILFAAADFPRPGGTVLAPPILTRTSAGTQAAPVWDNGSDINGDPNRAGPGVILPRVTITFNKLGIQIINSHSGTTYFLDRDIPDFVWWSFDGTTNAPIIYPVGSSFSDLESQVLGSP